MSTQMVILRTGMLVVGESKVFFFFCLISGDVVFESLGTPTVPRFFVVLLGPFRQLPG